MKIRHRIEYIVTRLLLGLCRLLPEKSVYALFTGLARGMYHLLGSRKKLTLANLAIAFPQMEFKERKRIAKQTFINLADSMAFNTLVMSGRISNQRLFECVEIEGAENLVKGEGGLAFTAHLGNWELMPQYAALHIKKQIHVIARKGSNPLIEERIVRPLRERFGVNVFYKKNAMMRIMKATRKGETCGILIDQRLARAKGVALDFFGKEAGTTATPALLQIRYGIKTFPAFMLKVARGKYRFVIGEPVEWTDNGQPMEDQVLALTKIHQNIVENMIRNHPDQWFWMHNRWGLKEYR